MTLPLECGSAQFAITKIFFQVVLAEEMPAFESVYTWIFWPENKSMSLYNFGEDLLNDKRFVCAQPHKRQEGISSYDHSRPLPLSTSMETCCAICLLKGQF